MGKTILSETMTGLRQGFQGYETNDLTRYDRDMKKASILTPCSVIPCFRSV
ncbi:hypothetical protein HOLDEFILI_03801 [Holdemania filiformis DSM 12042]|uniref:Uncharacterized protein n=1 Tax=Holdemania filiformis DSM 12042 TaxID=545696 RepID=B9YD85_9FIRM|nr:hypothetical protein HOLDEFILI_03801 [Holdemania filiformis DSM 12042]